jgi:hypothetical protein
VFSRPIDIAESGAFDNDPKCGERGMEFRVNGRAFAVPNSTGKNCNVNGRAFAVPNSTGKNCNAPRDSEVAFVAIAQLSNTVVQWIDDSGHFLLLVRLTEELPPNTPERDHGPKTQPLYSGYTRCEKLPPDAAGHQPLAWVRHAVLQGMRHTLNWSVITGAVTADNITYFPTNSRDIGVDSRVIGDHQPFKAIWRVGYDDGEKTVERSYTVFHPGDSTTWKDWPLTDELGRLVRYSGDNRHAENDSAYLRVLSWHQWVCSGRQPISEQTLPGPAPTAWVNAIERCDDNTIAISTGGENWPINPRLRVFDLLTGKMATYISYNSFAEQWSALGRDTARFKVELIDADTGTIVAAAESDQIGKRVDCTPAAPSVSPAANMRAVNAQTPHATVFFGNHVQMAARWMGAHDELPSTGLGQQRTQAGDFSSATRPPTARVWTWATWKFRIVRRWR